MKRVVIVGAGFAGLNAAKRLRRYPNVDVTVIDRENHHLFQPLLYQVAMAALSPADIAVPIRSLVIAPNVRVIKSAAQRVDLERRVVVADAAEYAYDYLLLACGAQHAYFGHEEWESHAPGLKSLPQATEIRRRVLDAFEAAEREQDKEARRRFLTFVVVGGGPTGVELAGAIGEMSRFTLAKDFRSIDPRQTRVVLVEAGPRILPSFDSNLAARAMRDLESLGVQVWTGAAVTNVTAEGVSIGNEQLAAATVLWAAGVRAADIGRTLGIEVDRAGRVPVGVDLTIANHPEVFVAGDMAQAMGENGKPLPGVALVAMQQGIYFADVVRSEAKAEALTRPDPIRHPDESRDPSGDSDVRRNDGLNPDVRRTDTVPRKPFRYVDLGQMATIGRSRAIAEFGRMRLAGWFAWWFWLVVHIYRLSGFRNRLSVLIQWAWSYLTFGRGARLIVGKEWQAYSEKK